MPVLTIQKMKNLFSIILVLIFTNSFAQNEFSIKIQDFSQDFEGRIESNVDDTIVVSKYEEFVPPYVIRIIDKKTNFEALKAYTSNFPDYLLNENHEAIPNVMELPYGSQSVLIYEDFNFDGIKDFALMNGYNSCYSGPSFDIYLVDKNRKIEYNESFSDLSNNYCGMFQTDPETKTIHTMTKSGCCWHQFSEFKIIENVPKPVRIIEESYLMTNDFVEVREITYQDGKETIQTKNYFPWEEFNSEIIFSFDLEKSGKKLLVYQTGKILHYVLILEDEEVEFHYPEAYYDEEKQETIYGNFVYDLDQNTLFFENSDAEYTIYETDKKLGIKVETKGKTYDLKGKKSTVTGTLKELKNSIYDNLLFDNY